MGRMLQPGRHLALQPAAFSENTSRGNLRPRLSPRRRKAQTLKGTVCWL